MGNLPGNVRVVLILSKGGDDGKGNVARGFISIILYKEHDGKDGASR